MPRSWGKRYVDRSSLYVEETRREGCSMLSEGAQDALCAGSQFLVIACNHVAR